ncbi:outer membrane receptor for ferrienterochelin and colicins [Lampropedia hyalina DSM 16112]|uniref:Outer membrane receptor for ferrienterochelin and colicins n=1 Tax=Lampropedia hyalina DSM 16112 TaxID=1122156 RepID=A0A1M5BUI5_9BURK|nr:FepA family TonB-dependent siderophore receptor [Lampropedia hyalina]SHF45937.1 outer membrane receptor for ferrienterochelin and colicins [Lampropedia hyalina DSM 16112]
MPSGSTLARWLVLSAAASLSMLADAQTGGAATHPVHIQIAAQPLATAIHELVRTTQHPVTYSSALVSGKNAPAVSGRLTLQQALDRLLAGSGLIAVREGGTFIVTPSAPPTAPTATTPQHLPDGSAGVLDEVLVTSQAQNRWPVAAGMSTITAHDIQRNPPANDLAELVRYQPGVSLTTGGSTGQHGNQRQINLRGMGPDNTLILIDGKPVLAREGVRMRRNGERDTRGDSNWVPADLVERVEVIRGPAAARYGSGAAGGVVNIITRKPADQLSGSWNVYVDRAEHREEQESRRSSFSISGPLAEPVSFRLYGNVAKSTADDLAINATASGTPLSPTSIPPAGRAGVRNRDLNGLLQWRLTPSQTLDMEVGFSRQGNIYTGERPNTEGNTALTKALARAGAETNSTIRRTASLTHRGQWSEGSSRMVLAYEEADRLYTPTGLMGSGEGHINTAEKSGKSALDNVFVQLEGTSSWQAGGIPQLTTFGLEMRNQSLDDPASMTASASAGAPIPGVETPRSGRASARSYALYLESHLELPGRIVLTPGFRFDHHKGLGSNGSPSLHGTYEVGAGLSLNAGIAKAFKAPDLYQANPHYLFYSTGNGCPVNWPRLGDGCYIQGNPQLQAEHSINKEIGMAYSHPRGLDASLNWFRNDYRNKIHAEAFDGIQPEILDDSTYLFRWGNAHRAIVQGLEGHLNLPLSHSEGSAGQQRLRLLNTFTYMQKNHNESNAQPLSVIPHFTLHSTLDWVASPSLSLQLTATFHGVQEARTLTLQGAQARHTLTKRAPYHLIGLSARQRLNASTHLGFGVRNLLDKRLFREVISISQTAGTAATSAAASYNEPGRSYYVQLSTSF